MRKKAVSIDETSAVALGGDVVSTGGDDGGKGNQGVGEHISRRNLFMFPLGTLGRDFLYNFFNSYLLTFILLTKSLNTAQFASISIIIICARIFDAFNDPIMGGIVENTRTKWGKYKPWQLVGAVLTGAVIVALFNVNLSGWAFIGFLAFSYFMFSITFTMNDISYWGMMPTLTSNAHDRDKLTSFTQIICSVGGGLAGLLVPNLTTGTLCNLVFGSSVTAYRVLSIIVAVTMVGFQLFTILGVKEKPLPVNFVRTERMKFKDMFKVIIKNDQLLWCSLIMILFNVGTNVVIGGLSTFYIYFEFAYDGLLLTAFSIGFSALSTLFTFIYPWMSKKFGRNKMLYSAGFAIIIGFLLMMVVGLAIPSAASFKTPLGITKFVLMTLLYSFAGWGQGFYMIMVINMANTVEYNEFKTGKREEGLIFSLRPFTAKLGSALMQGVVSLVFIIAGVHNITNQISDLENQEAQHLISVTEKAEGINNIIAGISQKSKMILLVFMCLIPIVLLSIALILYKKKCVLDEKKMAEMVSAIEERKRLEEDASENENADEEGKDEVLIEIDSDDQNTENDGDNGNADMTEAASDVQEPEPVGNDTVSTESDGALADSSEVSADSDDAPAQNGDVSADK